MKHIPKFLMLGLVILLLSPPVSALAHPANQQGPWGDIPAGVQPLQAPLDTTAIGPDTIYWRTGVNLLALPAYANLTMRNPTAVARFESIHASGIGGEWFFVFGAASRTLRVADAKVYILSRSGSYAGNAVFQVSAGNLVTGTSHHHLSLAPVDLEAMSVSSWHSLPLSANPDNRLLSPGQCLLIYFDLDGGAGGNLDVRLIFDVALTTHTTEIYLPMIRNTSSLTE